MCLSNYKHLDIDIDVLEFVSVLGWLLVMDILTISHTIALSRCMCCLRWVLLRYASLVEMVEKFEEHSTQSSNCSWHFAFDHSQYIIVLTFVWFRCFKLFVSCTWNGWDPVGKVFFVEQLVVDLTLGLEPRSYPSVGRYALEHWTRRCVHVQGLGLVLGSSW